MACPVVLKLDLASLQNGPACSHSTKAWGLCDFTGQAWSHCTGLSSLCPRSVCLSPLGLVSLYVPGFCFLIPFFPRVWSCPLCPSCLLLVVHTQDLLIVGGEQKCRLFGAGRGRGAKFALWSRCALRLFQASSPPHTGMQASTQAPRQELPLGQDSLSVPL